jgi:hypothetical protein
MTTQGLVCDGNYQGTVALCWTPGLVKERLEEAASTLARLPPAKVAFYLGLLPDYSSGRQAKPGWEACVHMHGLPKATDIARMEEALKWFHWLAPQERRLVWMRATRMNWKLVCLYIRYGRTEAWRRWSEAIATIVARLGQTIGHGALLSGQAE